MLVGNMGNKSGIDDSVQLLDSGHSVPLAKDLCNMRDGFDAKEAHGVGLQMVGAVFDYYFVLEASRYQR